MEQALKAIAGAKANTQQIPTVFSQNLYSILVKPNKISKDAINKDALEWCNSNPSQAKKLLSALGGENPSLMQLCTHENHGLAKHNWFKPESVRLAFLEFALRSPQAFKLLDNCSDNKNDKDIKQKMAYYLQCEALAQKITDTKPAGYDKLPIDKQAKALNDWREQEQRQMGRSMIKLTAKAPKLLELANSSPENMDKFILVLQNYPIQEYLSAVCVNPKNIPELVQPCLDNPALFIQAAQVYMKANNFTDNKAFYQELTTNDELRKNFLVYNKKAQLWTNSLAKHAEIDQQSAERLLSFWLTYGGIGILEKDGLTITDTIIGLSNNPESARLFNKIIEYASVNGEKNAEQLKALAKYAKELASLGISVHDNRVQQLAEKLTDIKTPPKTEQIRKDIADIITTDDAMRKAVKDGMDYSLTLAEMDGILKGSTQPAQDAVQNIAMKKIAKSCGIEYQDGKPLYGTDLQKITELTAKLKPSNMDSIRSELVQHQDNIAKKVQQFQNEPSSKEAEVGEAGAVRETNNKHTAKILKKRESRSSEAGEVGRY